MQATVPTAAAPATSVNADGNPVGKNATAFSYQNPTALFFNKQSASYYKYWIRV